MTNIQLISWILRGSQRRTIFQIFVSGSIPAQIFKEARKKNEKITRNKVSDILREFKEKKLVACINPDETKERIYRLTKLGEKIKYQIDNSEYF